MINEEDLLFLRIIGLIVVAVSLAGILILLGERIYYDHGRVGIILYIMGIGSGLSITAESIRRWVYGE